MPEIKSPIMNRQAPAPQKLRTFEVTDPTQDDEQDPFSPEARYQAAMRAEQQRNYSQQPQSPQQDDVLLEKQIEEARRNKVKGINPLSEGAKKRIEHLTGLGRSTVDVDIEGVLFTLSTLKSKEIREAINACSKLNTNNLDIKLELRRQQLARSIKFIDNAEFSLVIGSDNLFDKLNFVEELDESIVQRLDEEYEKLAKSVRDKYALKTEEDIKEVAEDLKK